MHVRLTDFGISKCTSEDDEADLDERVAAYGTKGFRSPEQESKSDVAQPSDVWSLAVTVFRLLAKAAWDPARPSMLATEVHDHCTSAANQAQYLAWLEDADQELMSNLLSKCLSIDPSSRPLAKYCTTKFESAFESARKSALMSRRSYAPSPDRKKDIPKSSLVPQISLAHETRLRAYYHDFILENFERAGEYYQKVTEIDQSAKSFREYAAFIDRCCKILHSSNRKPSSEHRKRAEEIESRLSQYFLKILDCAKLHRPIDITLGHYQKMKEERLAEVAMPTLYSVLLESCALADPPMVEKALHIFDDMSKMGIMKSERAYNIVIELCTDSDRIEEALEIFKESCEEVFAPETDNTRNVHEQIREGTGRKELRTYSVLIHEAVFQEGEGLDDALMLAQEMTQKYKADLAAGGTVLLESPALDGYADLYTCCSEQNRLEDFQVACAPLGEEIASAVLNRVPKQASSERKKEKLPCVVVEVANPFGIDDRTAALSELVHSVRVCYNASKLKAGSRRVAYAGMIPYYTDGKTTHLLLSCHDAPSASIVDTVKTSAWFKHWGIVQDKVRTGDKSFAHAAARALFKRLGTLSNQNMHGLAERLVKDFMHWTDVRVMYLKDTQTQVVFWRVSADVQDVLDAVVYQYKKEFCGKVRQANCGPEVWIMDNRWNNVAYEFRVAQLQADGSLRGIDNAPVLPELCAAASCFTSSDTAHDDVRSEMTHSPASSRNATGDDSSPAHDIVHTTPEILLIREWESRVFRAMKKLASMPLSDISEQFPVPKTRSSPLATAASVDVLPARTLIDVDKTEIVYLSETMPSQALISWDFSNGNTVLMSYLGIVGIKKEIEEAPVVVEEPEDEDSAAARARFASQKERDESLVRQLIHARPWLFDISEQYDLCIVKLCPGATDDTLKSSPFLAFLRSEYEGQRWPVNRSEFNRKHLEFQQQPWSDIPGPSETTLRQLSRCKILSVHDQGHIVWSGSYAKGTGARASSLSSTSTDWVIPQICTSFQNEVTSQASGSFDSEGGLEDKWTTVTSQKVKRGANEPFCLEGYGCALQLSCKRVHTQDQLHFFASVDGSNAKRSGYKRLPCRYFNGGTCKYMKKPSWCPFAHGRDDFRCTGKINSQGAVGAGVFDFGSAKTNLTFKAPVVIEELAQLVGAALTRLLRTQPHNEMKSSKCCLELYRQYPGIRESMREANLSICGLVKDRKLPGIQVYNISGIAGSETLKLSANEAYSMMPDSGLTGHNFAAAPRRFSPGSAKDGISTPTATVGAAHTPAKIEAPPGFTFSGPLTPSAGYLTVPSADCCESSQKRQLPLLVAGTAHSTLRRVSAHRHACAQTHAHTRTRIHRGAHERDRGCVCVYPSACLCALVQQRPLHCLAVNPLPTSLPGPQGRTPTARTAPSKRFLMTGGFLNTWGSFETRGMRSLATYSKPRSRISKLSRPNLRTWNASDSAGNWRKLQRSDCDSLSTASPAGIACQHSKLASGEAHPPLPNRRWS